MTFADPLFLVLLLLVPALAALAWWRARTGEAGLLFSDIRAASDVEPTIWARLGWLPTALGLAALALGIVALARPQARDVQRERFTEGIDIALVLDVSPSMEADDFQPNRFEAAKAVAAEFVDGRISDRIGLVVFAAEAYTQAPLTLDYDFLKQMLAEVQMGLLEQGTAIGTAIATAVNRLRDSEAESKVIILLTDGENNRGEIDPATAAEVAQALDVRIYTIGVGSDQGRIPGPFGSLFGGTAVPLDETVLRQIAQQTGGRYFRATDRDALRAIYEEIADLEKTELQERTFEEVEERYAWFLARLLGC